MSDLHLKARQRHHLRRHLHRLPEARVYRRVLAIWEVAQGRPLAQVAKSLDVSRQSLYHWGARYQPRYDPAALYDQ